MDGAMKPLSLIDRDNDDTAWKLRLLVGQAIDD